MLLLDINVLMALAWPTHMFHAAAWKRMEARSEPWATCALTQLGFIRLSLNPTIVAHRKTAAEVVSMLEELVDDPRHRYLEIMPSPLADQERFRSILGHKQVTDAYLLSAAEHHSARLLTFDSRLRSLATSPEWVELIDSQS